MKAITVLLLFSVVFSFKNSENYREIFKDDYTSATTYLKTQHSSFLRICENESEVLKAVVFPELLRYSMFRNLLETSALEILYVQYGTSGADFSIGRFQMKPSFAEAIEQHQNSFSTPSIFKYNLTSEKAIREERIKRLSSTEWQIQYLNAFHEILVKRWEKSFPIDEKEQVLVLATAYNRGMFHSLQYLRKHILDKSFPYGTNYQGEQYSYAEIALDYYKNLH